MRTLIVLCAGSRKINECPLFLLKHPKDGKLIAEKVIEGIFPESYDRIIYTILEEVDKEFDAEKIILNSVGLKYNVEVVKLTKKTSGPAETAYQTILQSNVDGEICIRDSHSYINIKENVTGNFIAGLDLIKHQKTIENLSSKSFIILNEQNQVLDVVEKKFRADVISGGLYGFKRVSDFVMAYNKLKDPNYCIQKLYVSHIISYLIGYSERIFHAVDIINFEDWSTVNSWARVQKKYATYFLDIDAVKIENDIDILEILKKASLNGEKFIGYTSDAGVNTDEVKKNMLNQGINILQIVSGCSYSKVKSIINTKKQIEDINLEV